MNEAAVLRLARSGIRSLPELEPVLRALLFAHVPPSELQSNLDALSAAIGAAAKKHRDSGASIAEMLGDFEELPHPCARVVRWVEAVLQGEASGEDVIDLAETIERVDAQPRLFENPDQPARLKAAESSVARARPSGPDAGAILRETGSRDAFENLVKAHTSGRNITPFVGAGFSAASGYPLWRRFLVENAEAIGVAGGITVLLDGGDYEGAAQKLRAAAEAARYRSMIESTFGAEHEPKGAVRLLPRITSGPILTLNYDRLIETVYAEAGMPLTRVIGPMTDTFKEALQCDPSPVLLKVHGDVREGTHRVLAADEYRAAYEGETARLPELLRAACIARRLLFLGCSFADNRMNEILASAGASSAKHFAILPADVGEETRRLVSSLEIEVIHYRAGQYGDIEVLLEAFIRAARSATRVTSRARNVLRKLGDIIEDPLAGIRKLLERRPQRSMSREMAAIQAASDERSIGVLVASARAELSRCREIAMQDGVPGFLLARIEAADQAMLMLKESRDRETFDTATRATKALRGAINELLHAP